MSPSVARINFDSRDSTSSPTYPASVREVASPMTSGTLRYEARDFTRWVLPEPEGPIRRVSLFSSIARDRSRTPSTPRRIEAHGALEDGAMERTDRGSGDRCG